MKYVEFVNPKSYIVVFDTITSKLSKVSSSEKIYLDNSPKEAIEEFLKEHNNFELDKSYNKLYVSSSQDGYLRRIK